MPQGRVVVLVQARMSSTRLSGKVMLPLAGRPMLERVLRRASRCRRMDELAVATTQLEVDRPIVELCEKLNLPYFCGSHEDVLDRFYHAACRFKADYIVRITADCPFVDPMVMDLVITLGLQCNCDYASNTLRRSWPRGLDVEFFRFEALEAAWQNARQFYQRSHVTPYIYEHPQRFRLLRVVSPCQYEHMRWTVDTPEDYQFARTVYEYFNGDDRFYWQDVLYLLDRHPQLASVNIHVKQKLLSAG